MQLEFKIHTLIDSMVFSSFLHSKYCSWMIFEKDGRTALRCILSRKTDSLSSQARQYEQWEEVISIMVPHYQRWNWYQNFLQELLVNYNFFNQSFEIDSIRVKASLFPNTEVILSCIDRFDEVWANDVSTLQSLIPFESSLITSLWPTYEQRWDRCLNLK